MNNSTPVLTFKEAIDMGIYDEQYLHQYLEWQKMDRHVKFQFLTQALKNRRHQLRQQWASLANQLDFSKKPHLELAQKRVEAALRNLNEDEERLLVEYAGN